MTGQSGTLRRYLRAVHAVHATGAGVPETSYYPAVSRLLEDVGATLHPRVRPVINIRNQGSGIPDGGLFIARATGPVTIDDPMASSAPERGAIEIKPPDRELAKVVASTQVRRYLERYGKVLVSTLRSWTLVVADPVTGKSRREESFEMAAGAAAFWALTGDPDNYAEAHEDEFTAFLRRVMEHDAPLSSPRDLAWLLAGHARTALSRVQGKQSPALDQLKQAISDTLGLTFDETDGEHFFRSTLIQTLFYGVFSAWVLWHRGDPAPNERFAWRQAAWHLNVPMVSLLFEKIAIPSTLRPLGVEEIMDWTEDVLARVERVRFFAQFGEASAVQYFYEPFLEHFDQSLRDQFGVWYTPPEVVDYMVEKVDRILRSEFNIASGFADERVFVLDPCVGTGSFLMAVLRRAARTLPDDALAAQDIKSAAMTRIYGFEILPAPYVVAHLQIGLMLADLGVPLDQSSQERVAVYLTNALTGWSDQDTNRTLPFPELETEHEAAHAVKTDDRILVVLGNPPYNPFSGTHSAEEAGLIEPYKEGIGTRHSLGDLYVRFLRVAERRIVEGAGHGIVSLITNFSYLHEPGFVQVRRILLDEFDAITIDNLNGDSRETGKRTPDGKPDPSVFSTRWHREGIQVGTAIGTFVRRITHDPEQAVVRYRDFWGEDKRSQLAEMAQSGDPDTGYHPVDLNEMNRLSFRPGIYSTDYTSWPQIVELAKNAPSLGLNENRGGVLVDPDRSALAQRMMTYLDSTRTLQDLQGTDAEPLTRGWARFDPPATRQRLLASGGYSQARIVRFLSGPLDAQWAYIDSNGKLWNEVRTDLLPHAATENRFLIVRRRAPRVNDGAALLPASCLGDQHVLHKDAYFIPFTLHTTASQDEFFAQEVAPNLSVNAAAYLDTVGVDRSDDAWSALLWQHSLAVGYSHRYLTDNPGGIAADWPRIPLPNNAKLLRSSADLGKRLSDLLDPLHPPPDDLPGCVGAVRRTNGSAAQPKRGDLDVTAQWGITQKSGAVMPGRGKLVHRDFSDTETALLGPDTDLLGDAYDIFLNEETYWACVPSPAWEFRIGGFQVLKKWLSYREMGSGNPRLLGRGLTSAEAREFTGLVRRLTDIALLRLQLDANYDAVLANTFDWRHPADAPSASSE